MTGQVQQNRTSHGPYIDAVVAALTQVGLDVSGVNLRDDPHRCAIIRLEHVRADRRPLWRRRKGDRDPVLCWSEVDG